MTYLQGDVGVSWMEGSGRISSWGVLVEDSQSEQILSVEICNEPYHGTSSS